MPNTTAQQVILEILRAAGGEWTGKKRLFKAFYFAHLYYADSHPGELTSWPIARMPHGPGIHDSRSLFSDLVRRGWLRAEQIHEGPYPETRFCLTEEGWNADPAPEDAQRAVRSAVEFCAGKTGAELTELTHEQSRSWQEARDGDILDINLDLIPDDEYEQRREEIQRAEATLAAIFGGEQA